MSKDSPLKPQIIYTFYAYEVNNYLSMYGLNVLGLAYEDCSHLYDTVGGAFWDINIPTDSYEDPIREALLSPNPLEKIAEFDRTYSDDNPYRMEGEEGDVAITSFKDLIAMHESGMYGLLEFWMSKLMLDGLIEPTDEYIIWLRT